MKRTLKGTALALAAASIFSVAPLVARAESGAVEPVSASARSIAPQFTRYELAVSKIYNKNVSAYTKVGLTHNGKALNTDARVINGTTYVAVRSFFDELTNMTVSYISASRTVEIRGTGLEMDIIDGGNVIYANGRTLFSMSPSVIMTNGRMYAPLQSIAKALGLSLSATSLSGTVKPLTPGKNYYAEDAVYWLSRIISAESRGESLLGQIAVGSVVMNRVRSNLYPNTIWGVIFDRKYGVQFSPILDGSIHKEPTASAVVAAKITLEGFNVNSESLFFLYPNASTSSWIPNNREYLFSIGKHDFYA